MEVIVDIKQRFASRFQDMRRHKHDLVLLATPFDVDLADADNSVQMELIELQNNTTLKSKFHVTSPEVFYKEHVFATLFPNSQNNEKKFASMFGNTYLCEQLFSKMNFAKNKLRSRLSDEHVNDVLQISCFNIKTNLGNLAKRCKQHQHSH